MNENTNERVREREGESESKRMAERHCNVYKTIFR